MCPLVITSLQEQLTATSAGVSAFPQIGQGKKDTIVLDDFTREVLNPTNAYVLYTVATSNAGTGLLTTGQQLTLTTSAAIGDDVHVRTSGMGFTRAPVIAVRSLVDVDIVFFTGATVTSYEFFVGLLEGQAAITALPTTARHMGVMCNTSASNRIFLTSANGTDQVTTDTGLDVTADVFRINITWTGNNAAVITLFNGDPLNDEVASVEVTSFLDAVGTRAPELCFYLEAEAAAVRVLTITEWRAQFK